MAGSSNGYSPDGKPAIWLCHQTDGFGTRSPDWLSGYERDVLSRFSGPREREYLTSRWLIRQALSHSARLPAHQCRPVDGRPVLSGSPEGWHLSLSHSHGLSACATRAGSPVGVDLEPCTRHPQWQKVARRWFSPVEQEWLFREDDPNTFLKVWTLKEAWLKATGRGIAGNLQTLEVRKDFEIYGDQPEHDWQASCCYIEGYLATLVFRGPRPQWPDITLLEPPPWDFALVDAESMDASWEPLFQRTIRPKR
ncbi:MAG TPA: 4'-phosphopantetheinyl transferase superfamily protein [Marinobacter sp.]|uniref:4'-phosphopantetheinyl transferase family protein n=1 Tax=Marinobacter sp. TaxID=50741 RepID=UPI002617245F|nr:4'-phosphopantetheinyl transferase superfamily protein [Marinobacter sp.]HET8799906.1 4'-phosphopantetheinyl transferase superfamily protein [Marinobacter sp.]